jgi:hypothetical protein
MLFLYFQINVNDPLPKTVCLPCIDRLEAHHELIEQFTWATQRIAEAKAAKNSQVSTVEQFAEILMIIHWMSVFMPCMCKI